MGNNWKTTLAGILAGAATIGVNYAPPKYQPLAQAVQALLIGTLGYHAMDK